MSFHHFCAALFSRKPVPFPRVLAAGLLAAVLLAGAGCGEQPVTVNQVNILQGASQCALPERAYPLKLRVELRGAGAGGWLSTRSAPVGPGHRVRFVVEPDSDLVVEPETAVTDGGGVVEAAVRSGRRIGDQYLRIIPESAPERAVTVRFVSGMAISGGESEGAAGTLSPEPIRVTLERDGQPLTGVPVRFELRSTSEGFRTSAKVISPLVITDAAGNAATEVLLGKKTGVYQIGVSVQDPERGIAFREVGVRVLGFNLFSISIAVLGGLAFFIFGMKLMSDGLSNAAGENMKRILKFLTRNGIVAVLAGTLVTAVLQSSAATTVMAIGFINAGLLSLCQSIGVIFGANIGTTVTAQIISFNLSGIAMPAIILGFLCSLSRRRQLNSWGTAILGFGLLFYGMVLMSDELRVLGEMPSFKAFFNLFNCAPRTPGGWMPVLPVFGALGIGIVGTVLVQSSSVFTGVVLALAGGGLVNFYTAFILILGSNVGTTVTTQLAAITANRVGKQAALAHTLFNVFGVVLMLLLLLVPYGPGRVPVFLYFINAITPGDAFAPVPQNLERHIAMAHTFFNIAVTVVLLPFIPQFAALCNRLLPIRRKVETRILEPGLLATPSIALKQTVSAIRIMVIDSWKMVDSALNEHFLAGNVNPDKIRKLEAAEERIDTMQTEVTNYLVEITRRRLTGAQSSLVPLLMHCTNDAERIADHTEIIIKLTERLVKADKKLSEVARNDLIRMWRILDDQARNVISGLDGDKLKRVRSALRDEDKINRLADKFESEHIARLRKGNCSVTAGVIYLELLGELAKIGDRLSNIAERTPELQKHYVEL